MYCMNCNAPLASIDYCPHCGADMGILKRIERISNMNYNEGLDKASVRDLSGAIACLKKSLRFNKYNIQARNLLGLVYFETGEVVSALSEWVISKNLQGENNIADEFITKLQANPNKLNTINLTIKKYNQALSYCYQKSEDMAVIQLKKVLNQNPRFIKGYQLLALLYIRGGEYEKARRVLKKAAKIDTTNTMTLRYIREVDEATGKFTVLDTRSKRKKEKNVQVQDGSKMVYTSGNDTVIQPTYFQDSSIVGTLANLVVGFVIGAAVLWFLFIPAKNQAANRQINETVVEYSDKMAQQTAKISSLEHLVEGYEDTIQQAEDKMAEADSKAKSYEAILDAAETYIQAAESDDGEVDGTALARKMEAINGETLDGSAKGIYDLLMELANDDLYRIYKGEGDNYYGTYDYENAITKYEQARAIRADDVDMLVNLAFSYYESGERTKAGEVFNLLIELDPNNSEASNWADYAQAAGVSRGTDSNEGSVTDPNTPQDDGQDPEADPDNDPDTDPDND